MLYSTEYRVSVRVLVLKILKKLPVPEPVLFGSVPITFVY